MNLKNIYKHLNKIMFFRTYNLTIDINKFFGYVEWFINFIKLNYVWINLTENYINMLL